MKYLAKSVFLSIMIFFVSGPGFAQEEFPPDVPEDPALIYSLPDTRIRAVDTVCAFSALGCAAATAELVGGCALGAATVGALAPACALGALGFVGACGAMLDDCAHAAQQFIIKNTGFIGSDFAGTIVDGSCDASAYIERIEVYSGPVLGENRITRIMAYCTDGLKRLLYANPTHFEATDIASQSCDTGKYIAGIEGYVGSQKNTVSKIRILCRDPDSGAGLYRGYHIGLNQPAHSLQQRTCAKGSFLSGLRVRVANDLSKNAYVAGIRLECKG